MFYFFEVWSLQFLLIQKAFVWHLLYESSSPLPMPRKNKMGRENYFQARASEVDGLFP